MRKFLFELVLLGIAIGLTVEVVKSAIPYLPAIWLILLANYTWELITTDSVLAYAHRAKFKLSRRERMYSYVLVGIGGAGLFTCYWWGLNAFFQPKIARYESELRDKDKVKPSPIVQPIPANPRDDKLAAVPTPAQPEAHSRVPTRPPTTQAVGNLKQRSVGLSEEIAEDLRVHGWGLTEAQEASPPLGVMPMPKTANGQMDWAASRSHYFKSTFLPKLISIRDEYAEMHLRNESLDDFLRIVQQSDVDIPVSPMQMEDVVKSLRKLTNQI